MLFIGVPDRDYEGLLYWGGVQSEHHKASLKRICPFVMSLISHLVGLDFGDDKENIFYERYIRLPLNDLLKLNFVAHINEANKSAKDKSASSVLSNIPLSNVFQLISLQLRDHFNPETDASDPIELQALIGQNEAITEQFVAWLQLSATNEIAVNVSSERKKQVAMERFKLIRPTTWEQVSLKEVPLQPDEEGYGAKEDEDPDAHKRHVADPLGLLSTDLREIQSLHIGSIEDSIAREGSAQGAIDGNSEHGLCRARSRGASMAPLMNPSGKRTSTIKGSDMFNLMRKIIGSEHKKRSTEPSGAAGVTSDHTTTGTETSTVPSGSSSMVQGDIEENNEVDGVIRSGVVSILPIDRSFNAALFLALVHNKASMADLKTGLSNLQVLLDQQSNMRENLVRLNLGHFINCVDSIAWLKSYQFENPTELGYADSLGKRRERKKVNGEISEQIADISSSTIGRMDGEKMASQAVLKLEVAKKKALDTLAPILTRMKRSRQIKATDSILKRFASALNFPHLMQVAFDKKDYEEVIRLNSRIKEMPNTVSLNIRTNILSKAGNIVTQMRKALTSDALRCYPFFSVEEVLRLFKNLAEIDAVSDYQIVLETCYERQHALFLKRYNDIAKVCDENLKRLATFEAASSEFDSPRQRSGLGFASFASPRSPTGKRVVRISSFNGEDRYEEQRSGGLGYAESDDDDVSDVNETDFVEDLLRTQDPSTIYSGIRMKSLRLLATEIDATFPILSCMVTLLEASSVAGAGPVEASQPTLASMPSTLEQYGGSSNLQSHNTSNLISAPATLLKGMDVAYGRRHGGASKYANMLGSALQKYSLLLKRLIEGFPQDVFSIAAVSSNSTSCGNSTNPNVTSMISPSKKGLWSRIDDIEKKTTPTIDDLPPAPPPSSSTTTSLLFAQGSGDGFGAAVENSITDNTVTIPPVQLNGMSKCHELILEPYLSSSTRLLSEMMERIELILSLTLSKTDESGTGQGLWVHAGHSQQSAAGRPAETTKQMAFLPRGNPFYNSVSSIHDVVKAGQEAIAAKSLKTLQEATTRLMLSQEANIAIEVAQADVGVERSTMDPEANESAVYDVSSLLRRARDNYKDTYTGARLRASAASVIPSSLMNPELTSFNDSNSRKSTNDDTSSIKYGASLETKAYQFEYMIVHVLVSLHDSLRCPELLSNFVESAIRNLFTQFLVDLASAECPVLDDVYSDESALDAADGLFGTRRSQISMDLEIIELDLKVDGGAGDKNVLIDGWYLDQIRACLAIRSVIVYRVCLMLAHLFPEPIEDVEDVTVVQNSQQAYNGINRSSLSRKGGTLANKRMSLSLIKNAASNILSKSSSPAPKFKRSVILSNVIGKNNHDRGAGYINAGEIDPTSILAYLKDIVLSESNEMVASIIVEVCGVEDSIVQRYLEVQTLKLRTSIQASYSVVVKSELTNKWGQSSRQALINMMSQETAYSGHQRVLPSSRVPSCLARVLFEMSLQRVNFILLF